MMQAQLQALDEMSKCLLRESSAPAQALRRSLLRNKNILIIGGGAARNAFIYHQIVDLGTRVFVTDAPSAVWRTEVRHGFLSGFIPFDFSDLSDLSTRFSAAFSDAKGIPSRFDAALSFDESHLLPAAVLADALNLAFQPVSAVTAAQNKSVMRAVVEAAGIPSPRFQVIRSVDDARAAVRELGAPIIVKPTNGFHSAGVQRADNEREAAAAYRYAVETIKPEQDIAWGQCGDVMAEQFLPGPEVDVDVLMSGGEAVYVNVVDNWASVAPWFEEHGFDAPSLKGATLQADIRALVVSCIRSLGFQHGLFHTEARCTKEGPRLLEVNPRIGGGPIFKLHHSVWGVDLVEELCFIAIGLPSRPLASPEPQLRCIATCFPSPYSGFISKNGWLSWTSEVDGRIISFVEFLREGEHVVGTQEGFPDNLGHLVIGAPTRDECVEALREIYEKLEIPVVPVEGEWSGNFLLDVPKDYSRLTSTIMEGAEEP